MCSDVRLINERNRHSYRPQSEGDFSLDSRITFVLSEEPFLSVCQIAKKAAMSKSMVCPHLMQTMRTGQMEPAFDPWKGPNSYLKRCHEAALQCGSS
jgi:hypothetical protein